MFAYAILQIPILLPFAGHQNLLLYSIGVSFCYLIYITLVSIASYLAWRLVGWKTSIGGFFATNSYMLGIILILTGVLLLIFEGIFYRSDPVAYMELVDALSDGFLEENEMPILLESNLFDLTWLVAIVSFVFLIYILVLSTISWGAYRQLNGLSKWKSFVAFIFTLVFCIPPYLILESMLSMFGTIMFVK